MAPIVLANTENVIDFLRFCFEGMRRITRKMSKQIQAKKDNNGKDVSLRMIQFRICFGCVKVENV